MQHTILILVLLLLTNYLAGQVQTNTIVKADTVCCSKFPDGDQNLYRFINKNLKWPSKDPNYYVYGKVYVKFMVDTLGLVRDISILKGLDSLTNNEALRVMSLLPKWIPPDCSGRHSNVWHTVQLSFKVK